jgi:hypothetical protein
MPGRSVSYACLLRQVSSGLSRNCRNERRPDVDEAWFVAVNFMAIAWARQVPLVRKGRRWREKE